MKIAFWSSSFFGGYGGAEVVVAELLNALAARGETCFLLAGNPGQDGNSIITPELDERIQVRRWDFRNPLNYRKNPFVFLRRALSYLWSTGSLFAWLARNRPDVIHQHFIGIDVVMLVLFKRLLGFRLVLTFHGMELELASDSALSHWKTRLALRHADQVTAVSRELCGLLRTRYGASDIHFIPNALDVENIRRLAMKASDLSIPPGHFVYCGRVDPEKQVPGLIEAFGQAIKRGCESNLYIMGDGDDDLAVQSTIERLGVGDRVFPLGVHDRHDALRMIHDCRCLVLNSSSEGCPLVILEAMALRKPVIAPAIGGIPDMVSEPANGWLFPAGDAKALCSAILRMAEDGSVAGNLGNNTKPAAAGVDDLNAVVRSYQGLYSEHA